MEFRHLEARLLYYCSYIADNYYVFRVGHILNFVDVAKSVVLLAIPNLKLVDILTTVHAMHFSFIFHQFLVVLPQVNRN